MAQKITYACDNSYDSEKLPEGYVHRQYGERQEESTDPAKDGWFEGIANANGVSVRRFCGTTGWLSFCSAGCLYEWTDRCLSKGTVAVTEAPGHEDA